MRIFWPVLRYVFKNSARYTLLNIEGVFLVISTFLKNTHDRNTYCSLLRDLRAHAQSVRHVKREEREKELLISARVPTAKPTKAPPITPVLQAT